MGQVIELNKEFRKALNILENSSKNVFITGKAGTGKSTLLDYFRGKTKKKIVVLAPTGVAAVNIRGETIHSFFHFKPNTTLNKIKKIRYPKTYGDSTTSRDDGKAVDLIMSSSSQVAVQIIRTLRRRYPKKADMDMRTPEDTIFGTLLVRAYDG